MYAFKLKIENSRRVLSALGWCYAVVHDDP